MTFIAPATLLIVTYNQERFIRDTIRAALGQDYQKLQIVIADDGSADKTIDIVKEEICNYQGPHSILIISDLPNIGLFGNIQRGVSRSTGDLIVISAGDDVPFPYRVSTMVNAWKRTGAISLHSQYDVIDDFGQIKEAGVYSEASGHHIWSLFQKKHDREFIGGATAAYSKLFLSSFPKTNKRIFHEDSMLTIAVHAMGGVTTLVPISTIQYRVHDGSYSNATLPEYSKKDIIAKEIAYMKFAQDTLSYLHYLRFDWLPLQSSATEIALSLDMDAIISKERSLQCTINALSKSPVVRFLNLKKAKSASQLKAALLRMFGIHAFATSKITVQSINRLLKGVAS